MHRLVLALSLLAGCTADASPDELHTPQGACDGLDETSCKLSGSCQQAYVNSGFQPGPTPLSCLEVETSPTSQAMCAQLDHDHCRARSDCSPVYWQELGPSDAPVGDPTYQSCQAELFPNALTSR